jgi:hypothetical protein
MPASPHARACQRGGPRESPVIRLLRLVRLLPVTSCPAALSTREAWRQAYEHACRDRVKSLIPYGVWEA